MDLKAAIFTALLILSMALTVFVAYKVTELQKDVHNLHIIEMMEIEK